VEVVEEQLLVHARFPGDLIDAGAVKAAPGELLSSCGDDS
jgi:hypothetical protein